MPPVRRSVREARLIERVWEGASAPSRLARAALAPLAALFRGATTLRNALYDRGILESVAGTIPVISVGNLTVGGTGKTPVSAWIAGELLRSGARPVLVTRGYGADEPLVHGILNPGVPVIIAADRAAGVASGAAGGATVAVLDDAFQHRSLERTLDLVLLSAEDFSDPQRVLPAGPWREPLGALARASAAIVTRKVATDPAVSRVIMAVRRVAPALPVVVVSLEPDALRNLRDVSVLPLPALAGKSVLVIAAIARPGSFVTQVARTGATCTPRIFPDHHPFSAAEIASLASEAGEYDRVVCTLKDAVKLDPVWPRAAASPWYVSQRVVLGEGGDALRRMLEPFAHGRAITELHGDTHSASAGI